MFYPFVHLAILAIPISADIFVQLSSLFGESSSEDSKTATSYSAHFGGAFAGLFLGVVALRSLEDKRWGEPAWWVSFVFIMLFFLFGIIWNFIYATMTVNLDAFSTTYTTTFDP